MRDEYRLFYVADIHGSERCFRKWLNAASVYQADAILIGGDISGKLILPITDLGGQRYRCELYGRVVDLDGKEDLARLSHQQRVAGRYVVVLSPDEKRDYDENPQKVSKELWPRVAADSVRAWVDLAEERLAALRTSAFVMLGNDDFPELADLLVGNHIANVEGEVTELPGGFEMISLGYSNRTPWDTPRELDEDDLASHIKSMAERLRDPTRAVFNLHCPPYQSGLDEAPILDADFRPKAGDGGIGTAPVGSTAVRAALETYQPMLGLHGHIHECPGGAKIGRTLAINPGSDYGDGILRGAVLTLSRKKGLRSWQLIQG
jgi:Icc-related predicted phosphoesterase